MSVVLTKLYLDSKQAVFYSSAVVYVCCFCCYGDYLLRFPSLGFLFVRLMDQERTKASG